MVTTKGETMKYSTYLFDFDGTLVDSMPSFVSVMLRILDESGVEYGDDIIKIITYFVLSTEILSELGKGSYKLT